jgi:hypothetical protein
MGRFRLDRVCTKHVVYLYKYTTELELDIPKKITFKCRNLEATDNNLAAPSIAITESNITTFNKKGRISK